VLSGVLALHLALLNRGSIWLQSHSSAFGVNQAPPRVALTTVRALQAPSLPTIQPLQAAQKALPKPHKYTATTLRAVQSQHIAAHRRQAHSNNATKVEHDLALSPTSKHHETSAHEPTPTKVPANFEWHFAWASQAKPDLSGTARWTWTLKEGRFEARFEAESPYGLLWRQISLGGFDADGLAPDRFTDERPKAGVRATNFQQTARTVTFSGPSVTQQLEPGLQDPLSALIQFMAILRAQSQPPRPSDTVSVQVMDVRANQTRWVFRLMGEEALPLGANHPNTHHWARDPLPGFEGGLEIWLDVRREFVPVRLQIKQTHSQQSFVFEKIEAGVTQ
jgi:hypothetical protein